MADAELRSELAIVGRDRLEHDLVVADQIHLVDRQHHVANPQQRGDVAMPPRLRQQTLACIDQDHGQVGAGRTGGHVARVLLVPRAVGHDELAPRSTEITIGRSEEHTSELQSLMRISYAVFCLKKKNNTNDLSMSLINLRKSLI